MKNLSLAVWYLSPCKTALEVGLVGASPQDSHPPIPCACTVSAQRTTSWGEGGAIGSGASLNWKIGYTI